jgi:hypothetical protein
MFLTDCSFRIIANYAEASTCENYNHSKPVGEIKKVTGYYDGRNYSVTIKDGWHRPDGL